MYHQIQQMATLACMKMQETIMTNQQFLKHYLVVQQIYRFQSTTDMLQQDHNYNTQSYLIGIDNHASASMTNSEMDFVDTPAQVNLSIKGIKGHLSKSKIGTIRWIIQDDGGRPQQFDIPGTYLVPELPVRLLSLQHVAREIFKKD